MSKAFKLETRYSYTMTNRWSKSIPDGMRDIVFRRAKKKRETTDRLMRLLSLRGFSEIVTPTLEFYDVFSSPVGSDQEEDMYKLFDSRGRILALRHDMTTPIARVVGTKLMEAYLPIRLSYCSSVFRRTTSQGKRRDELTQLGAELIGIGGFRADADIIVTALESLEALGIEEYKLELGHIGLYRSVCSESISDDVFEALRLLIDKKNLAALASAVDGLDISGERKQALKALPTLFGGSEVLARARQTVPFAESLEIINYLEQLYEYIKGLGLESHVIFDLGMVHHINYYTGLIFRGYVGGSGETALAGGRYDSLVSNFGRDLPATGFAINIDSVCDQYGECDCGHDMRAVVYCECGFAERAMKFLSELRDQGISAELSLFSSYEESLGYARSLGAQVLYTIDGKGIGEVRTDG